MRAIVAAFLMGVCSAAAAGELSLPTGADKAAATITPALLRSVVAELASDAYEGRARQSR